MTVLRSIGAAPSKPTLAWMEKSPLSRGSGTRGAGMRPAALSAVELHSSDLSASDVYDQMRDPQVLVVAPEMPVQLVRPMAVSDDPDRVDVSPANGSWGVDAVGARRSGLTGRGVVVAILDTGIVAAHPAFAGVEFQADDLKNFTEEDGVDLDGHGTHCAGTVLGRSCFGRGIGIAPGVTRALVGKVVGRGGGSTDAIYRALLWAQGRGAHIVSMSVGMDFTGFQRSLVLDHGLQEEHATSLALAGYRANVRLFDRLSQVATDGAIAGTVVVAAAGNESRRPGYAITVSPPAAAELYLSVGALEKTQTGGLRVAPFSNEGVTLAAPGVDIWSAAREGGLCRMSGTSMAAPHVVGVAALWAEKLMRTGPFKAGSVIDQVRRNARKVEGLADADVGEGLVQAPLA